MKHQYIDGILYFYFYGDLDNLTVCNLKQICIDLIEKYQPKTVQLDFEESSPFVNPAPASVCLARHKQLPGRVMPKLILCNLSRVNQTLFKMSGIFEIMKHERNEVKL